MSRGALLLSLAVLGCNAVSSPFAQSASAPQATAARAQLDAGPICPADLNRLVPRAGPFLTSTTDASTKPLWLRMDIRHYDVLAVQLSLYPMSFDVEHATPPDPQFYVWTPSSGALPEVVDIPNWGTWEARVEVISRRHLEGQLFDMLHACVVTTAYGYINPFQALPVELAIVESPSTFLDARLQLIADATATY